VTIKAVIFDLDGTIVNFNLDYKAVRADVIQFLTKQGFPSSIISVNESIFDILKKLEIYMRNHGEEEQITKVKEDALSLVNRHELEAAHSTSLMPGALEALKELKKMGLKTALFTVNSEKSTSYILRCFRLKRFFDAVVTREHVWAVKPNPAHLEAVLRALGIEPEEAVVVGDSVGDMKCAKELNVVAVGMTAGISSPEELNRAGATYLVSSFAELLTLIRKLAEWRSNN